MTHNLSIDGIINDTLPSWHDGSQALNYGILGARVGRAGSPEFIPPPARTTKRNTKNRDGWFFLKGVSSVNWPMAVT
jgi:hypothetical protein